MTGVQQKYLFDKDVEEMETSVEARRGRAQKSSETTQSTGEKNLRELNKIKEGQVVKEKRDGSKITKITANSKKNKKRGRRK